MTNDSADATALRAHIQYNIHASYDPMGFFLALDPKVRNDPRLIAELIGEMALRGNLAELARRVGMSRVGLRRAMMPSGNPSFDTVARVVEALGLTLQLEIAS